MKKSKVLSDKVKAIKKAIKDGAYDWNSAVVGAATRIVDYPEALLWR